MTAAPPVVPVGLPSHRSPYGLDTPIRGEEGVLVRPYLVALDERRRLEEQAYRRLSMVLAADFGVDLDGCGVGVAV